MVGTEEVNAKIYVLLKQPASSTPVMHIHLYAKRKKERTNERTNE